MADVENQCSCDSILSRLIYGYTNYRKTMESLHPNLPGMAMDGNFGNAQPMIGASLGMPTLGGLPFIGG